MKLQLTQTEIEAVLLDCFCNGGISELYHSGVEMEIDDNQYQKYQEKGNSYEDNLLNILKGGGKIEFVDVEGGDESVFLTMELAQQRLSDITDEDVIASVGKMDENNYQADAWDGYNVIQYILYGEIIFG